MIESFITAFIIYFVVIDPIGNAPIFPGGHRRAGPRPQDAHRAGRHAGRDHDHAVLLRSAVPGSSPISIFPRPLSRLPVASSCFWWRWTCWRPNARPANVRQATGNAAPDGDTASDGSTAIHMTGKPIMTMWPSIPLPFRCWLVPSAIMSGHWAAWSQAFSADCGDGRHRHDPVCRRRRRNLD